MRSLVGRRWAEFFRRSWLGLGVLGLALSGCLPTTPPPSTITPTATATRTPTTTPTIIWFPATATFTPYPTRAVDPTEDMRPGLGGLILEDDFQDTEAWQTQRSEAGNVAYGRSELTLAVSSEKGVLSSLRKTPQLFDFYLEIDMLPSLCRAGDSYGLLLRVTSLKDYYRLLFNCNGQVRMERLMNSKYTVLRDWTNSGQVLPGGMMRAMVGVWALDDELRVFINDVHQFTVHDTVWTGGQVGVFARSAGETPLTVSFSRMAIYNLASGRPAGPVAPAANATQTATPRPATATPTP